MDSQVFEKYFKLPLSGTGIYVFSQPNERKTSVTAFNWLMKISDSGKQKLLDKINGVTNEKFKSTYIKVGPKIFIVTEDKRTLSLMLVRGWGMLTGNGVGGFGLAQEEAEKIQDQFVDYVLGRLNG